VLKDLRSMFENDGSFEKQRRKIEIENQNKKHFTGIVSNLFKSFKSRIPEPSTAALEQSEVNPEWFESLVSKHRLQELVVVGM
jgi:hypothetical protein